uniref:Uncharacterized protein n=1 Tax=Rhizophora mucronata TaxID=61149 RepID=A0A2P2NDG4_RHIMU
MGQNTTLARHKHSCKGRVGRTQPQQ